MVTKPTNVYKCIRVSDIINIDASHVFQPLWWPSARRLKNFCNISFVMHLPEDGHKIGQIM
jgi:hypothetical protein